MSFTAEPCDACKSVTCEDFDLCDVPTGAALRAAVAHAEAQPINSDKVRVARSEIEAVHHNRTVTYADEAKVADFVLAMRDGRGQYAGHAEASRLLKEDGLTISEVAAQTGLSISQIVSKFTQLSPKGRWDVLEAERLLRAGATDCGAVAKAVGAPRNVIWWFAQNLGLTTDAMKNRQGGGGTKYTAAQIAQAWKLRDAGVSYRLIAEAMPDVLKDTNAALGLLRRNARPSDNANGVGTVAA